MLQRDEMLYCMWVLWERLWNSSSTIPPNLTRVEWKNRLRKENAEYEALGVIHITEPFTPISEDQIPIPYEKEYIMCNNLEEWCVKYRDWAVAHPRWLARHPEIVKILFKSVS